MVSPTLTNKMVTQSNTPSYWYLVPTKGLPILMSGHATQQEAIDLATRLAKESTTQIYYKILKQVSLVSAVEASNPMKAVPSLFDIKQGTKLFEKEKFVFEVTVPYWKRAGQKLGQISICHASGGLATLILDMYGNDKNGTQVIKPG